jgi:Mrp family chromosome partitioning ATPase
MLNLRKKTVVDPYTAPLTIRLSEQQLLRTFSPDVVNGFRQMTTELNYAEKLPKCLAVVSALNGDGVTFTALALATVLANDTNKRVCVVDLNWWRPGIGACLDPVLQAVKSRRQRVALSEAAEALQRRPGVAQLVAGEITLDEALVATDMPNLSLLMAGDCPLERRPALVRSEGLSAAMNALLDRFDHVVLDVPAVLTTSDAIPLASFGDSVCMVVRHGVTSSSSVQLALDTVKHLPMLGVILNQVSIKTPRWIRALIPQE